MQRILLLAAAPAVARYRPPSAAGNGRRVSWRRIRPTRRTVGLLIVCQALDDPHPGPPRRS